MKKLRLSNNQREIIKAVGALALISASFFAPNILQVLKPKNDQHRYRFKRSLKRLVDKDFIYLFGEEIHLTKKGQELLKYIEVDDITFTSPEYWDGKWYLVCYDIPEFKKKERDYFRSKLIQLGFKMIQDSLWVLPYNCKEEIAVIAQSLGIAPFVAYLTTDYLPQQQKLIWYFNLQ